VQEFCRQKEVDFYELSVDADPNAAKNTVETWLGQFCRQNAIALANEKKNLSKDEGGSCNLV